MYRWLKMAQMKKFVHLIFPTCSPLEREYTHNAGEKLKERLFQEPLSKTLHRTQTQNREK